MSKKDTNKKPYWDTTKFKSEAEYLKFLDMKSKQLRDRILNNPELLNVFKRLNNR